MPRILVIADDFTGAAEIAGAGWRYGLDATIFRPGAKLHSAEMTVIDTDSRSLDVKSAAEKVRDAIAHAGRDGFDLIFKKIDSVLRGPVLAELEAAVEATGRSAALLLPANPSRGRTILGGQYFIDGELLDQTSFAADPEHPARSADVLKLLGPPSKLNLRFAEPVSPAGSGEIVVAGAISGDDVMAWAAAVRKDLLPVGGVDFFAALLAGMGLSQRPEFDPPDADVRSLFVSGTTAAGQRQAIDGAKTSGAAAFTAEFDSAERVIDALLLKGAAILSGASTHSLAQRVERILAAPSLKLDELLVEGGATASAVSEKMGWREFRPRVELAAGVVQLEIADRPDLTLTLKPGSYPWPAEVWRRVVGDDASQPPRESTDP